MAAIDTIDIVTPTREEVVGYTLGALDDLTPEEWVARPHGLAPVLWQVGHIAFHDAGYCQRAGLSVETPDGYEKVFKQGSSGDGPFPPVDEVVKFFKTANAGMLQLAKGDSTWSEERRQQVGEGLTFMLYHLGYHSGKVSTLRALLGKKRLT